jgi:hypothetical protein
MKPSEKKLIEDYFAQSISEEDISSLNELLLNSEEARSFYLTYASVMENLDESRQAHNLHNFGQLSTTRFSRKKGGKWLAIAASIIFAVFFLNHFVFQKTGETDRGIAVNSERPQNIQLIDFFGLDETRHLFIPGQTRFEPGEYKTASGKLHLRFGESVDVIFAGAFIFEIHSEKEIFVQQGNIRTIVHDASGHEFTIRTPNAHYIDWGTEFSLNIQPNSTDQLEVDEGLVEVQDSKGVNSFGKFNPYKNSNPENAPFTLIDLSNDLPGEAGFARWKDMITKKSKDPDLLGLYTFEFPHKLKFDPKHEDFIADLPESIRNNLGPHYPRNLIINNAKTGIASHGVFRQCNRSYGRWPENKSLKFSNKKSVLHINLPGKFEEFTLQAWLQMHQSNSYQNSLIRSVKWDGFGRISLRTNRVGKASQSIWGETNLRENRCSSTRLTNDWQLISYTFGKENGRAVSKIYINKELVSKAYPKFVKYLKFDEFLFGASINGKTGVLTSSIDGGADELSLWAKTFSEKDIEEEYNLGYPFYQSFSPELVQK